MLISAILRRNLKISLGADGSKERSYIPIHKVKDSEKGMSQIMPSSIDIPATTIV